MTHPDETPRTRARSITMADVARIAGVSSQTVSRVLSAPQTVSAQRRERVLKAIQQTNYVHNAVASNLASSRSRIIAAILPLISNSIFADTVQGLTQELLPTGHQVIIGITEYDSAKEESIVRGILGLRPQGVFMVGTRHSEGTRALLQTAGIPVVEGWDQITEPIDGLVGFSNRQALLDLMAYLSHAGFRNPVFCGMMQDGDNRARERLQGFNRSLKTLFGHEERRQVLLRSNTYTMAQGRVFLHEARKRYPDADVLVFTSDLFAAGALLEAQRCGLHVPDDIAITGFGGYDFASETNPPLTTVSIPATEIGTAAARLILDNTADKRKRRVRVAVRLTQGGSA